MFSFVNLILSVIYYELYKFVNYYSYNFFYLSIIPNLCLYNVYVEPLDTLSF